MKNKTLINHRAKALNKAIVSSSADFEEAVAGVEKWEQMKGKTIRVKSCHSKVEAIGHIVKDDWFNPGADFKRMSAVGG